MNSKPEKTSQDRNFTHWEFWPAWLFYLPIGLQYVRLAWRYGGFGIPAHANPGIETGGIIGESKMDMLQTLQKTSPEFTARSWLLNHPDPLKRLADITALLDSNQLQFPFILKPDVGQRGSGVKCIRSAPQITEYLMASPSPVVAQEFVQGPFEAGLFYFRFPNEMRGHIFSITEKQFPCLKGDGRSTIKELILENDRARRTRNTYFKRFHPCLDEVLELGVSFPLVQTGNHAQGCIFKDGFHLYSKALRDRFEAISKAIPGFFIGRYDVRFRSKDTFMQGNEFKILELNGAASEATHIYDPNNTLRRAYGTLFRQWELVFRIGHECQGRNISKHYSGLDLLRRWLNHRKKSKNHPVAD